MRLRRASNTSSSTKFLERWSTEELVDELRWLWNLEQLDEVAMHQSRMRIYLVQHVCAGMGVQVVRALREPLRMSTEQLEGRHAQHPQTLERDELEAWLSEGGFIAAGDGLSETERKALAAAAVSPGLNLERCSELLEQGASLEVLPPRVVEVLRRREPFVRLQVLANIWHAVASDGMSGPEWVRFCEVATEVFGAEKVTAVIRYCLVQSDALKNQIDVMAGQS